MIDGVAETWSLVWRAEPSPKCVTDEELGKCACWPFAFAEEGEMDLVRSRPGEPDERLDLNAALVPNAPLDINPSASSPETVIVQRWIPKGSGVIDPAPSLEEMKTKLRTLELIKFGDYDHDGRATEFLFRVAMTVACGHNSWVVPVGISKKNPQLHVFESVEGDRPPFGAKDWERIRAMGTGGENAMRVVTWRCGDHAAGAEESVIVRFDSKGLHTKQATRPCPNAFIPPTNAD